MWPKLENIVIIITILSPGCQQPFLIKMASDNRLSAAVFGPKWLVTTGCQQPLPILKMAELLPLKRRPFTISILHLPFKSLLGLVDKSTLNSQKAEDKIYVCKFSKKVKSKLYHIENFKDQRANSVDQDEVAHYEPPHRDLCCLQIQLFLSLVLNSSHKVSYCCGSELVSL